MHPYLARLRSETESLAIASVVFLFQTELVQLHGASERRDDLWIKTPLRQWPTLHPSDHAYCILHRMSMLHVVVESPGRSFDTVRAT